MSQAFSTARRAISRRQQGCAAHAALHSYARSLLLHSCAKAHWYWRQIVATKTRGPLPTSPAHHSVPAARPLSAIGSITAHLALCLAARLLHRGSLT